MRFIRKGNMKKKEFRREEGELGSKMEI